MGGVLVLNEDLCWMPASWIFDNVLGWIAERLTEESSELSSLLSNSQVEITGVGYLDITNASEDAIVQLMRETEAAVKPYEDAGASSFAMPEMYDGFMKHLRQLHSMLVTAADEYKTAD